MGVYLVEMSDLAGIPAARTVGDRIGFDVVYGSPGTKQVDTKFGLEASYADAYGGAGGGYNAQTLNRAWQTTGAPHWVYWRTDDPDPTGAHFPGPGVFGTTTNYGVESIVYVSV